MNNVTYLDHAASSFPKPDAVIEALSDYLRNVAISPHHSSHVLSQKSGDIIKSAKENIAKFMGCKTHENILYTQSATFAINQILLGFLKSGDHVVYSSLEHNAVVRPLKLLEAKGIITTDIWQSDNLGNLDLNAIPFKKNTRLLLVSHSSNLNGKLQPVREIVEIAHERSVLVGVDASQSLGFIDINVETINCDFLFFTGHKALMGPTGIGGAYIKNPDFVDSVIVGGGGDNSVATTHPKSLPEKFSPGTMNSTGIVGLSAGIKYISEIGLDKIRAHAHELIHRCCDKIANLDRNIEVVARHNDPTPVLLLKFPGLLSLDISKRLSEEYGIATRGGLHCAPIAHKSFGTYPNGALRISFGYSNTKDDVDYFIKGLRKLLS